MGLFFSSPKRLEHVNLLFPEGRHFPYHGGPVPDEVSLAPEDSKTWYDSWYDKAFCAPHKDGQNVIIFWPPEDNRFLTGDVRETEGWAITRLRKIYEAFNGNEHPRIVR
jgi:hypothetical protein